jgi:ABC-type transport system substrate-binding protein
MLGFNPALRGYAYNPVRARRALAAAGYPGGRGLAPIAFYTSTDATVEQISEAIQAQLGAVGIRTEFRRQPWPQFLDSIEEKNEAELWYVSWRADYTDAQNFLQLLLSTNLPPAGSNNTRYRSAPFDSAYSRAVRTTGERARRALYQQAERIAVDDAAWAFIYHPVAYRLSDPNLAGLPIGPFAAGPYYKYARLGASQTDRAAP